MSGFSQPGLLISLIGLGNYPQDPSAYGPTRPSHSYGQDEQGGYSAGRCQHRLLQPQKVASVQYCSVYRAPTWVFAFLLLCVSFFACTFCMYIQATVRTLVWLAHGHWRLLQRKGLELVSIGKAELALSCCSLSHDKTNASSSSVLSLYLLCLMSKDDLIVGKCAHGSIVPVQQQWIHSLFSPCAASTIELKWWKTGKDGRTIVSGGSAWIQIWMIMITFSPIFIYFSSFRNSIAKCSEDGRVYISVAKAQFALAICWFSSIFWTKMGRFSVQ